jgi:hypothetical protein
MLKSINTFTAPVTSVQITQPSIPSNNKVVVTEDVATWFVCSTGNIGSRPSATVTWDKSPSNNLGSGYKNMTGGDYVTTYNYVSATFTRSDQDSTIKCTGSNSANTGAAVSSSLITLDVWREYLLA